jgi:hypothetical protein
VAVETFTGESGAAWQYDPQDRIGDPSGMGQVFGGRAADGAPVAVKRVLLRLDTDQERQRREREVEIAAILAGLPTSHVLPTLDVGRVGDDLLIVMPRARRSLAAALAAGDLDEGARFDALVQVTEGLVELAPASVLHRDLKPANVLEHDGHWQLADFGIARALYEATGTYTFLGWGTHPYMAPELWSAQPASVKTDLYALGVIAYEVLTGARPFAGPDELSYRRQHLQDPPPPAGKVPAAVGRIMLRLLAKNPAERPQDARAVLETLQRAGRKLSAEQDRLREAALVAEQRRRTAEAQNAQEWAAHFARQEQRQQASSDLREILEEARDQADEALDGVALQRTLSTYFLVWQDVSIAIDTWPELPVGKVPAGDPLVAAGAVQAQDTNAPMANVVCEQRGDRLEWSLLRFKPAAGARYDYGPPDRPHGFNQRVFADQRQYMRGQVIHVWAMERKPLTPEAVVELLGEAIAQLDPSKRRPG